MELKVGNYYKCIKDYTYGVSEGDLVRITAIIAAPDLFDEVNFTCDNDIYSLEVVYFDSYFEEYHSESIDEMLNMQFNEVKCDCGSLKTYGENIDLQTHASWCSLKKGASKLP